MRVAGIRQREFGGIQSSGCGGVAVSKVPLDSNLQSSFGTVGLGPVNIVAIAIRNFRHHEISAAADEMPVTLSWQRKV